MPFGPHSDSFSVASVARGGLQRERPFQAFGGKRIGAATCGNGTAREETEMEDVRFDGWTRGLTTGLSRRGLSAAVGGALATLYLGSMTQGKRK